MSRPALLFVVLCVVWGSNWLAVKIAVVDAPPLAFAAVRSLGAGLVMLAIAGPRPALALLRARPVAVIATAVLANALTYAGLYWGAAQVPSGLAAIVNNALMPIGLAAFGAALGEERIRSRTAAGIALGIAGLVLLFARRSAGDVGASGIAGLAAIVAATFAYCGGSIASRPLLRESSAMTLGALQMLLGSAMLAPMALALEPIDPRRWAGLASPASLAGLAWLIVAGGVAGMTIYLKLLHDWGPTRVGMYAFVAPIVATTLGAAVLGERLGAAELLGGALMLAAAALVLGDRRTSAPSD